MAYLAHFLSSLLRQMLVDHLENVVQRDAPEYETNGDNGVDKVVEDLEIAQIRLQILRSR